MQTSIYDASKYSFCKNCSELKFKSSQQVPKSILLISNYLVNFLPTKLNPRKNESRLLFFNESFSFFFPFKYVLAYHIAAVY